jgi:hypothetical protein
MNSYETLDIICATTKQSRNARELLMTILTRGGLLYHLSIRYTMTHQNGTLTFNTFLPQVNCFSI